VTTVYVVPCGVSVLEQLGKKLPPGGSHVSRFTRAIDRGAWLNGVDLDNSQAAATAWSDKVMPMAKEAGLGEVAAKRMSAETHTLATRVTAGRLAPGQHVLLLASDTKTGLTAAFCVGQYLAGFGDEPVAYASSPRSEADHFALKATRAPVTVIRVRGLKPAGTDFNLAAMGIGRVLRAAWDAGGTVEVHLTGGFKATLLHTLAMSEVLHSMEPGRVSAWNVFEDVTDPSSGQPVQPEGIGLRTFRPEYLTLMRTELSGARDGSPGGSRTLEGVGWAEDEDGRRRLNSFGHGYLAVLGDPASALGDDNT
jgi:hypothetical protein